MDRRRWNHHTTETVLSRASRDEIPQPRDDSSSVQRQAPTRRTGESNETTDATDKTKVGVSSLQRIPPKQVNVSSSSSARCGDESQRRDGKSPMVFQYHGPERQVNMDKEFQSAQQNHGPEQPQENMDTQLDPAQQVVEVVEAPPTSPPLRENHDSLSSSKDSDVRAPPDDMTTSTESLTVLSAFSLVTPPSQWIQKESFLHRRKKLEQWGIPISKELKRTTLQRLHGTHKKSLSSSPLSLSPLEAEKQLLEATLTERLVWVKYQNQYWWPAILYDSYRQLIQDESLTRHVWYRLPLFWQRIQLASLLVFHKKDPRNHCPVARLLGRGNTLDNGTGGIIELVEVEDSWPFKDEPRIAKIIDEMAFNGDYFRDHPTLYLDWHRAMDQVELLLCECLGLDMETLETEQVRQGVQRELHDERRQRKQAQAVAAALAAATGHAQDFPYPPDGYPSDGDSHPWEDENNSLVASTTVASSLELYKASHERVSSNSIQQRRRKHKQKQNNKKKTWLERAKEAEHEKWVMQCHDCSAHVLDAIKTVCIWKDDMVASVMNQPTSQERRRLERLGLPPDSLDLPPPSSPDFDYPVPLCGGGGTEAGCFLGGPLEGHASSSLYYAARTKPSPKKASRRQTIRGGQLPELCRGKERYD